MFGPSKWTASSLPAALLVFITTLSHAPVVAGASLASVIAGQANLTIYNGMLKDYPDIFAKLPSSGATIIAPTDLAFSKLQTFDPKNRDMAATMLLYHTLQGKVTVGSLKPGDSFFASSLLNDPKVANVTGGQKVIITKQPGNEVVLTSGLASRTTILKADIPFDDGFVQVIDALMVAPARFESTARDAYTDLSAFLGALYTTGLVAEFAETANITIFIPRNAAFQQLAGTLGGLNKDALTKVLRYHLVPNIVIPSGALLDEANFTSAYNSTKIHITRFNNDIFVNSARIIQTDILIANGVVQMIDGVLNPDKADVEPEVSVNTQLPVFTVVGPTATGTAEPTPFITALPCTVSCPVTNTPGATGGGPGPATVSLKTSTSKDGVPAARCTGLAGVAAGVGVAMGVWGLDLI